MPSQHQDRYPDLRLSNPLQANGTARLYAGAFKAPEEANLLTDVMRAAGLNTSLVYRTGRVY